MDYSLLKTQGCGLFEYNEKLLVVVAVVVQWTHCVVSESDGNTPLGKIKS